jgi:hypothetical protein
LCQEVQMLKEEVKRYAWEVRVRGLGGTEEPSAHHRHTHMCPPACSGPGCVYSAFYPRLAVTCGYMRVHAVVSAFCVALRARLMLTSIHPSIHPTDM